MAFLLLTNNPLCMTTILVVDDEVDVEPLLQSWFRRKIQQKTYRFRFAHNGREALTMIQADPTSIDLVLLDINMPEMDGLTLLSELLNYSSMLAAVMVSAYGDMNNIRTAMNRGAFDFVTKPIDFADLEVTIEKTASYVRQLRESQQLKVISELKTRFFDNITHEFRTPLTLILSPVEKLLQRHHEPADLHTGLLTVERNAQQLLRLINQLLDLAKLESGHLAVTPRAGDLADFVGQIINAFRPVANEQGLALNYETNLTDFYLFDAEKIEQIVYNLVANALKFTHSGEVSIYLRQGGLGVQLRVVDTGIGIAAEKLTYIFNRFYQVIPSPVDQYQGNEAGKLTTFINSGTGIGLALVKELAELMNGTVAVQSAVGDEADSPSGTIFTVELPLPIVAGQLGSVAPFRPAMRVIDWSGPTLNSSAISDESDADQQDKPLVLVVEDNAELCAFLAGELATMYRVMTATDGTMGLQLAQSELPDLVLTDVMMPGMDGYELTHRLKTEPATDHIAVVMLTAKTAQPSRIEGLQQGADDYIGKPFHLDELHLRIHNLLVRQQTLRAHYQERLTQADVPFQGQSETMTDKFLQKLYGLIELHLDDSQFGVEELAHEVGMSRRTLYRKLTAVANLTINDFMRQYRLKRGIQFLREGHNVSETAYLIGYESPAHFTTIFKEFYHKTPSEFIGRG
jgi:signal transduction histidine kinase/AraC-like DNA-binding protein